MTTGLSQATLGSSVRRRELGRRLRSALERAGIDGRRLASVLGWSETRVSRMLNGRVRSRDVDVASFLAICGVVGAERDQMFELCDVHQDEGLLRLPKGEHWSAYLAHASGATRLTDYQPLMIPWMVQTPDYTRALLPAPSEVETRRAAVTLLGQPRVDLLLHEWALRTPVHSAALMSEQLHHLLRLSVRETVSIRIVPIGRAIRVGGFGPFTLLEFEDKPSVAYREEPAGGVFVDNHVEAATHQALIRRLAAAALGERESRDLIIHVATDMYGSELDLDGHQMDGLQSGVVA